MKWELNLAKELSNWEKWINRFHIQNLRESLSKYVGRLGHFNWIIHSLAVSWPKQKHGVHDNLATPYFFFAFSFSTHWQPWLTSVFKWQPTRGSSQEDATVWLSQVRTVLPRGGYRVHIVVLYRYQYSQHEQSSRHGLWHRATLAGEHDNWSLLRKSLLYIHSAFVPEKEMLTLISRKSQ